MDNITAWVALAAGILSFLSPCILPLAPGYLSVLSGISLANLQAGAFSKRRVFLTTLSFVSGFTLVFVLMGVASSFLGRLLLNNRDWLARVSGIIIILLGLHQAGWLTIPWLLQERRVAVRHSIRYGGAFLTGLAFSLGWTPCVGPVLATILALAGNQGDLGRGLFLLLVYSLGLALPFLGLALAFEHLSRGLNRLKAYFKYWEWATGALLIIMGMLLLTGGFTAFSSWIMRFTGGWNPENILK